MTQIQSFIGFTKEQQEDYEKQAAQLWDPDVVHQSNRIWKSRSPAERNAILANGERITLALKKAIPLGVNSPETQKWVKEWHQYLGNFYQCPYSMLLDLGKMYSEAPEFRAFYTRFDRDLPDFLYEAIKVYCASDGTTQ
ncbi:MAG: TipAS antibiotic-recognition domain-containing protein [Chloroflexi bacterium]|nr:TipAS antibiotic-recognition domain-containing protein [Chloroflexota bacterium]